MIPNWIPAVTAIVALAAGIGGVWRYVIRPALRLMVQIDIVTPTLRQIAKDFQPNGRPSLKQQIDSMREDMTLMQVDIKKIREAMEK